MSDLESSQQCGNCRSLSNWSEANVIIDDFESLPHYAELFSPSFSCHGAIWRLRICNGEKPGESPQTAAAATSHAGDAIGFGQWVSAYLICETSRDSSPQPHDIEARYEIKVRRADGQVCTTRYSRFEHFTQETYEFGFRDIVSLWRIFDRRSDDILVDGKLSLEVRIQVKFYLSLPPNPLSCKTLRILDAANSHFNSANYNDVTNVKNDVTNDTNDVTNDVNTFEAADICFQVQNERLFAHRAILQLFAPELAELCEGYDFGNDERASTRPAASSASSARSVFATPIPVSDIDPPIFYCLLRYVYGSTLPPDDIFQNHCLSLLTAADMWGVPDLKHIAERHLASPGIITVDNVADWILVADAKNCAILKKAAVNFFLEHSEDVMTTSSFRRVMESDEIIKELVLALSKNKGRRAVLGNGAKNKNEKDIVTVHFAPRPVHDILPTDNPLQSKYTYTPLSTITFYLAFFHGKNGNMLSSFISHYWRNTSNTEIDWIFAVSAILQLLLISVTFVIRAMIYYFGLRAVSYFLLPRRIYDMLVK